MDASALRNGGWAAGVLRSQEMPSEEIRAILTTDDPDVVRRYLELHLELHQERLEERLADQRRALAALERLLLETAAQRWSRPCTASPDRQH